jgi:hypothetical protein
MFGDCMSTYYAVIESWVRTFITTMNENPDIGDTSGKTPPGVKIIFDGYGLNEDTNQYDDINIMNFAVFIHKDSLKLKAFLKHEATSFGLVHRPEEEVCINCYYDIANDVFDLNPFEDGDTELQHEEVYQLIHDLNDRHIKGK